MIEKDGSRRLSRTMTRFQTPRGMLNTPINKRQQKTADTFICVRGFHFICTLDYEINLVTELRTDFVTSFLVLGRILGHFCNVLL